MQGLGGQDEDRRGGFERGGWALPLFDDEAQAFLIEVYQRADAFLFGRRTYEIFAGYWGVMTGQQSHRGCIEHASQVRRVDHGDRSEVGGHDRPHRDLAAAIAELKAKPGGELQVHGSGALIRWLFDNQLVDEIILLTYPVVVGQGTRLFADTGPDSALELVESQSTPKGVIIQVYRPSGRPQYAPATGD